MQIKAMNWLSHDSQCLTHEIELNWTKLSEQNVKEGHL